MSWKYEVLICLAPDNHGDSCQLWTPGDTFFDHGFRDAFKAAATQAHAIVRTVSPHNGNVCTAFHHIEGGGLCEWCGPATGRRGPWMRTPAEERFMCAPCVADAQNSMDALHKANGWSRSRSYWPVLEKAEK
ncbi:hypothetical protein [Kitasatospora sp. NBC_01302]|uniref:hypothetical protein n=1 Tax=Kitasatospora sp. NBC_01302 TaxID=2903575 RepID=UPI002E104501|nr:hypothetical protein OG294_24780 [Kitasatospora sp. NBC_01302]